MFVFYTFDTNYNLCITATKWLKGLVLQPIDMYIPSHQSVAIIAAALEVYFLLIEQHADCMFMSTYIATRDATIYKFLCHMSWRNMSRHVIAMSQHKLHLL